MANRHLARSIVLQTLYEWDFRQLPDSAGEKILLRNIDEFAAGFTDFDFLHNLLRNIFFHRADIDKIIAKAAPDWPFEKISFIDRNVLRLGLFELLFSDKSEVPAKVAINEAIELAKSFGGDRSGKFVNGVLGSVYKELGEPGKEAPSRKHKKEKVPFEEMLVQRLAGAVVYARKEGEIHFALVHDVFGHWTLSKGKLLPEEDEKEGVIRKIKEEIGLSVDVKVELGRNEYIASDPTLGKIRKQVIYFLVESGFSPLNLKKTGGLDEAKWFKLSEIQDLNFYEDILIIVTKAVKLLHEI